MFRVKWIARGDGQGLNGTKMQLYDTMPIYCTRSLSIVLWLPLSHQTRMMITDQNESTTIRENKE